MNTYSLEERTINSMLDRSVEKFGDNKFASSGDWSITYLELNNKVNSCANFLCSLGVTKGTKVALMLRNSPAFIFSWLAVSKLGGIYVPINTDYKGYTVWQCPPNTQGLNVLMSLNIYEGFNSNDTKNIKDEIHLKIEAVKAAFSDGLFNITDFEISKEVLPKLLSKSYAESKRKLIKPNTGRP